MTKAKKRPARPLKPGLHSHFERVVPHDWTIAHYDPRLPAVLSTPAMIAMMETASALAVRPRLPKGAITVGTRIEVDHLKAVPEGARVRAQARLTRIDGRFLIFEVEARSNRHQIGKGRVYRAVVNSVDFFARAQQRKGGKTSNSRRKHRTGSKRKISGKKG